MPDDPFAWLRGRDNPLVLKYLRAENAHLEAALAHTRPLQERLFAEIKGRIKQTDSTVPYRHGPFLYYTRTEDGKEYPIHCRRAAPKSDGKKARGRPAPAANQQIPGGQPAPDPDEQILLDLNELSRGHDYYAVGARDPSSRHDILAFAEDTRGDRVHTIRFKRLDTGAMLDDSLPRASGYLAWANDNRTLFYATLDPRTLRSYRVYRHVLGTHPEKDALVYEEQDEEFSVAVSLTKTQAYVVITAYQTVSTECRVIPADRPDAPPRLVLPRQRGHEYEVDHFGDHFYLRTNDGARNFRLMRCPVDNTAREQWEEVIPHQPNALLEQIEVFRDHLVVEERHQGLMRFRICPWSGIRPQAGTTRRPQAGTGPQAGAQPQTDTRPESGVRAQPESGDDEHYVAFDEPAYVARLALNPELDTAAVRFHYTSLTTPPSVYDYDMQTRGRTLLKREEVLGDFDPARYRTERLAARAADGTEVPISLVYRKDLKTTGGNPLLLYGYGAYGISSDPYFNSARISLLDRGFVYAIAHVRGGEDLGRAWYEDGRQLKKQNTFSDFIACGEHLIRQGYAHREKLFALGGSAGGLLMGAVANQRPDLFCGVIAHVPFVDVVNTMLDESLPPTTGEYDEWGDPRKPEYHDYILSYSPYDNVTRQAYPHLLITGGLYDSQVQYWEPAKWVAKLRSMRTNDRRLLLKINMVAGHQGASGRYRAYREVALDYAFLLDLAGVAA